MEKQAVLRQLWEVWPGKNRFFFKGKIMMGPRSDLPYYLTSLFLIVSIPCVFFIFIGTYLVFHGKAGLFYIEIVCFVITLCFYFLASCTDPGIVPRRNISVALNLETESEEFRMCTTCYTYRSKRSHHCRECDNCVEIFDHHCKFINNCVGARNYTFFFFFLLFLSFFCILSIISCFVFIFSDYEDEGYAKPTRVVKNGVINLSISVILISILTILGIFPLLLCLQHFLMCFTGQTTKERLYGKEGSGFCHFLRRMPSKFDPQQYLSESQLRVIMAGPIPVVQPEQINIELSSTSIGKIK